MVEMVLDTEMTSESCGRRGEGRTSSMASEVCMDKGKGCVKAELRNCLDQPDQQKCKAKKRMGNYGYCMLNALPVLEDRHVNLS